jgi:predicted PurR-regulated permease PerM
MFKIMANLDYGFELTLFLPVCQVYNSVDQHTARVLATICAFVAIGAFLYGVRHTLVVILFAVLFAYLLEPVVYRIERSRLARGSRWLAILETYLAIGAILAVFGILVGPKLVEDTRLLSQSLPGLLEKVTTGKIVWQLAIGTAGATTLSSKSSSLLRPIRQRFSLGVARQVQRLQ